MPSLFKFGTLSDEVYDKIKIILSKEHNFNNALIKSGYYPKIRNCKTLSIIGTKLNRIIFPIVQKINLDEKWNFKLVEPNDYSLNRYQEGDFYRWHTDGSLSDSSTYLRKVSFSLGLSNDYEGGDFLIEAERSKDKVNINYNRFHLKEKEIIVFKSDLQHCVEPVTSGTRDSLVGWIYGPKSWNL